MNNNGTNPPSPTTPGIIGYRNLTDDEKALMNAVKAHAEHTKNLIDSIAAFQTREVEQFVANGDACAPDKQHLIQEGQRWRIRATDSLQLGYMELVRAIARPTSF